MVCVKFPADTPRCDTNATLTGTCTESWLKSPDNMYISHVLQPVARFFASSRYVHGWEPAMPAYTALKPWSNLKTYDIISRTPDKLQCTRLRYHYAIIHTQTARCVTLEANCIGHRDYSRPRIVVKCSEQESMKPMIWLIAAIPCITNTNTLSFVEQPKDICERRRSSEGRCPWQTNAVSCFSFVFVSKFVPKNLLAPVNRFMTPWRGCCCNSNPT